jgi:hypothetical protein
LLAALLLWWGFGPWPLLLALASLAHPAVRDWLGAGEPLADRLRLAAVSAAVTGAVALVVVLAPDGWLPIPSGPGRWVTPSYVGRAAIGHEVTGLPTGPGVSPWPGPEGDRTQVDTAWFGGAHCRTLLVDPQRRLVGLCAGADGPEVHLVEPDSMRVEASRDLPASGCGGVLRLDARGRAVAASGRAIWTFDAALGVASTTDLTGVVAPGDCIVGLAPTRAGTWFVTSEGRLGLAGNGRPRVVRLQEHVTAGLAADGDDVYAVTTDALYRVSATSSRPRIDWRTSYDNGIERKPGQPSQGSGTTPAVLPGGLVAIADNADPRMNVLFLRRTTGEEVCRAPVFASGESATGSDLVPVGARSVVIDNNHGYDGRLATVLGRATSPGIARVDAASDRCHVAWTSDQVVPSASGVLSTANGLLYTYTTRHSWWGVNAWYLTALDPTTGRPIFSVRTGLGSQLDNDRAGVTLAPDGSAYVPTLAGLVRVHDR